ncbi:hypothetical protein [Leptospira levettii]|uniref:DUF695 domain-containing protein n=1 Tax=Leptospira levettii TaxID=2023178 RepID=A0AAW5VBK4_9LEPT|nr:hypothetical protein [Leptospira levettii]MCW7512090.1 hypothetical protein [Leptospira levettii]MCW7517171.1 hypothetical protein [Leptospira levettii]
MILNNPLEFDYDITNDDEPELYTYTFDLRILEEQSNIYSDLVWESVKKALNNFAPEKLPNFVIFCGDNFYDGLPISFQIGILGDIEKNLHKSFLREFEKNEAFVNFEIDTPEYLVAKYRFFNQKVYVYNNWEEQPYNDYNLDRLVIPRYLFNEDWMNFHGIE